MKKKIIASMLVVVMLVLMLVGCGAYDFTEENLDEYVTFNYDALMEGLGKIEIEDADFTGDPEKRKEKIVENIFSAITSTVKNEAKTFEKDKLDGGKVGERDIVYFCYYATDADGNIFEFSNMKESAITSSSTSSKHVVELGGDEDAESFLGRVALALKGYDFGENGGYSMSTSTDLDDTKVKAADTVVVSYTVTWNTYKEGETDKDGKPVIDKTYKQVATFERLLVSGESENRVGRFLSSILADENYVVKVGSKVAKKEGSDSNYTHEITDGGVKYTYSDLKIEWKEENEGTPVSFTYTPYTSDNKVAPDSLHNSGDDSKVNLKDTELTYHIYPVYYLSVPTEVNAYTILRYVLGSKIGSSTIEALSSEDYKNGDKTVKALVEALVKVYNEDYEKDSELANLLKAYEDAAKLVKDKGDDATETQKNDAEEKELAYLEAQRAEIKSLCEKIAGATSTAEGAKPMSELLVEQHKENVEHSLTDTYASAVTESVEKAVYKLIFNNENVAKLTGKYPEKLVDEFKKHLYEKYEYNFYKGTDSTTKKSNYSKYEGDLEKYMLDATGAKTANITTDQAIEKEAKEAIGPLLILYACAKECEKHGAADKVVEFINADIAAGLYDPTYADDATAKEKEEADKEAEENKAETLKNGRLFLIDEDAFKEYKKSLGRAGYREIEQELGERNIRAILQFNRLFYYLTGINYEKSEDDHIHAKTFTKEGSDFIYLDFRMVDYTIKASAAEDTEADK